MSTLPLLMSLADELDNINTRTFPDDFGLGFYPHRHYNRNPSLQLSLPSDTEWREQRRQSSRTTRKYYSTESPKNSASPTTTTNHYQNDDDDSSPINNSIEQQNEKEEEKYYNDDDHRNNDEYICNNTTRYNSRKFQSTVKVAVPAIDSKQRIIDIQQQSNNIPSLAAAATTSSTNQFTTIKETKKLNNTRKNCKLFGGLINIDDDYNAIQKDGGVVKNKKNIIRS